MESQTTADVLFDKLAKWGVDRIFGLPGDGINGLMEGLRTHEDKIHFTLVRHEEAAAFAAVGYAKMTGRIGVCIGTSGPGAIHLLNGLYDAKLDQVPVLALTGQTYSDLIGSHYQQEVNMIPLFSDVAVFNVQVTSPEHVEKAADLACRTAIARQGVAHLNFPIDVQEMKRSNEYTRANVPHSSSATPPDMRTHPDPQALRAAAQVLNEGHRVVILAGSGARGAQHDLLELARALQAPIVKPLLGKDIVPDDHPLCFGGLGLLGTAPAVKAMEECDTLLMLGTSFPYMEYLPKPGQARAVQVDLMGERLGIRYPIEIGIIADAPATVRALLPLVQARNTSDWLTGLQGEMRGWWELLESRASRKDRPMKPQVVAWELGKRLADDAIVTCDSGTIATWAARYIKMRPKQRFTLSGTLATMAPGLPYAIGAQTAFPDRQVVAFVGDGGFLMLGSDFSTAVQHNLPIKVVVIKNKVLGMIKWEQMVFLGNPSFGVELPDVDLVGYAKALGGTGFHVDRAEDLGGTIDEFLAHDGPALLEAVVDPNEPPMPPKVKLEQAVHMAEALARGTPNATRIALTLFRDKVDDLFVESREAIESRRR
jgi:pyruvate dehydrogenase (quinone)/pyruvate oxidase